MSLEQLLFLALVQGVTEFLPVSSSAHLNLVHLLTELPDEGLLIDVAVHAGTLLAVLIYFRADVVRLVRGAFLILGGRVTADGKLALYLLLATVPIMAVGFPLLQGGHASLLRTAPVIAWANIVFAVLLYGADRVGLTVRRLEHMQWGGALAVGLAQVFSLIPGASRAGTTITMARFLGYERTEAARFSMLLSIPTIIAAAAAALYEVVRSGDPLLQTDVAGAAALSFVSALATIAVFMKMLQRMTLTPFVLYRLVLGGGLLYWIYS